MKLSRRAMFAAAAGAFVASGQKKTGMITLSQRPEDLEMPLSGFADYITPIEHFFVRTHVYVPTVELKDWRLEVGGEVSTPITLTMADLRKMPSVEMIAVVECAGNGRSFYRPTVPGLQWSSGSVGNARWRGVRLADVLKRAGIKSSAVEVLFDGADQPIGKMQDFRRSITAKKALDPDTLLAYEMNGQPLPVNHGFPLRVIAAGWASDSWVKWLTSITVLDKEFDGFWMKSSYRRPDFHVEPGAAVPLDQMKPVTSLHVKTQIYSVAPHRVDGVSWSGDGGPVTAVEVSIDQGGTWKPVPLRGRETKYGWRQWSFTPASSSFLVRAHDASGAMQPTTQEWNPSGYGWNVVASVKDGEIEPAGSFTRSPPEPTQTLKSSCLGCHGTDAINQQHLTRAQWDREITKMTNWGAEVKADDRDKLLDFLSANFKP
jgi:sulfite oxidase